MNSKNALVCGSSKGIGASTAIELSKLGVSITLLARNKNSLSSILDKLDSSNGQNHNYLIADFDNPIKLKNTIIMETGGMKRKRKEVTREELHSHLKKGFGVSTIYSEYSMTELLSQSYSLSKGVFHTPNWMKVLVRDVTDPFFYVHKGQRGLLNIIDLANIYSCPFIATQDLGRLKGDGLEVLGRVKNSEIRGCNLLLEKQ